MAAIKFEKGLDVLQFSKGIRYPVEKPIEKMQVVDRTAAGTPQVEDLGVTIRQRLLAFRGLTPDDRDGLVNWFENICNGSMEEFTYYDENDDSMTVIMLTLKLNPPETSYQRFSANLLLEVVS